jgi:outer membrane protein assembly factor BamB
MNRSQTRTTRYRTSAVILLLAAVVALVTTPAHAQNWPQWRGPQFSGAADATGLPVRWSATENVLWKTPLPGFSGATPAVWGDSVFVTSPNPNKELLLFAINRRDGSVRWQKKLAEGDRVARHNNMASPSPLTDGERVYAMFGTGDVAALDFDGNIVWQRNLARDYGRFALMFMYGASPLLHDGRLYVAVMQRNPPTFGHAQDDKPTRDSYLLCLDPKTGRDLWRQVRQSDALDESMEAYTTPVPWTRDGRSAIIVSGADYITAHAPDTGAEIWRTADLNPRKARNWRVVASPVAGPDHVYAPLARGSSLAAVGPTGQVAWTLRDAAPDVCTPLLYRNRLYVFDGDKQVVTCLDPRTGGRLWQGNLGVRETFRASPTGGDGKIYCISENGTVVVLEAGDQFKILASFSVGEFPCRSSIAIAGNQLFVRTGEHLYCVGAQQ